MSLTLPVDIETVRGFLDHEEGVVLYDTAFDCCGIGPCLEVGSYCGRSTVYIGTACQSAGSILFAVDHHRGSAEHQPGRPRHDPTLFDADTGQMDTFAEFRRTLGRAALEDTVVPVVARSRIAARYWRTPLGMVFIDGGHSMEAAMDDYRCWSTHLLPGGVLAFHALFDDPAQGEHAPLQVYRMALASGLYSEIARVGTLGLLRRIQ